MSRPKRNVFPLSAVVALFTVFCVLGAQAQSQRFDDPAIVSIRVQLGVTDKQPRSWNGKLSVSGGEFVRLSSWRPHTDDEIQGASWKLASWQGPNFRYPAPKPQLLTDMPVNIFHTGLIVDVRSTGQTTVRFETEHGNFRVDLSKLPIGESLEFLDGSVVVDRTLFAERLSSSDYQNDFASILTGPEGELWVAWVAYRDWANEVFARRYDGRAWGPVQKVTEKPGDVFLAKLGRDGQGRPWVVWSGQVDGNRDLYGRRFDGSEWSAVERLTTASEPDIYHALATDSNGNLWLVWQGFRDGQSDVLVRSYDGERWSPETSVSSSPANDWEPSVAADQRGNVYVAWDSYDKGNYDVMMRRHGEGRWSEVTAIADTKKFEAHVTLACDPQNRLWAAWSESGAQWGKDNGFGLEQEGTRLYEWRTMAVAALEGDRRLEPLVTLDSTLPDSLHNHNDMPTIQADGDGRMWVFFRHRNPRIQDIISDYELHRAAWEMWGVPYSGGSWGQPVPIPASRGRMDMRSEFALRENGEIVAAWPTDNRTFSNMIFERAEVYAARIPKPRTPASPPRLKPRRQPQLTVYPLHPNESEDVRRIRNYEIRSGGKTYRIYRGDTHRHTEFSMDGLNDGSLQEAYRYAIDAAGLDYYANTEHNFLGGPDVEYHDWLLQQYVDCLMLPKRFVTLFAYERSVRYPNGHRNILFAKRGIRPFLISREEFEGRNFPFATDEITARSVNPKPASTKLLYEYLKKNNGIAISHTSATNMGTDWRDNDPQVEPLVEIYQGDRVSAEYEGAPRAANAGNPRSAPGGFQPAGYVWNAWAKGYKLGVQAASDHVATHISYACTIAEDFTREGLMDAMQKRHSYGATDNIILDYRLQAGGKEYLQGDIATVPKDFRLSVRVIGTQPIRQIDIIKNQSFLHNRQNLGQDVSFTFIDQEPSPGENYYYVRVIQVDDQIAWSSPIWVTVDSE